MSRRAHYPLQLLLQLREHRTESARMRLLECQRQTQACRDACTNIEGEIERLKDERKRHRTQLMSVPTAGVSLPMAMAQRERYIEHLADLTVTAVGRLEQAKQALRAAEQIQDQARTEYFRARSRQEALEKRKDVWRKDQRLMESRREEAMTADLVQGRSSLIQF